LNWDDLRYLLALHRQGSVTAAARALKVDHSTIGRRNASLESELGAQLVVRQPDGMKLTDAGREAVAAAEAMDARLSELSGKVGGASEQPRGHVRVSVTDGLASLLYGGLAALHEDYPEIVVDLVVASAPVDLARGEADIALRLFRESRGDLVARKVGEMGWSLYAAPSYLSRRPRRGTSAGSSDLRGHDVIGFADAAQRSPGARWLEGHLAGASVVFRGTTVSAALNAAKAGMGVAVLPCFMTDASLERMTPDVVATTEAFLVTTVEARSVARVRIVGDALANMFVRERSLLSGALSRE
jgi:DNA-binding transcriptional LysR family regulator